ncbi:hypothetical protein [Rhodococcus sp. NCIMB 12038]|nr:hypothetical protein [Rhodococcus sp. NCIMB 12038]
MQLVLHGEPHHAVPTESTFTSRVDDILAGRSGSHAGASATEDAL